MPFVQNVQNNTPPCPRRLFPILTRVDTFLSHQSPRLHFPFTRRLTSIHCRAFHGSVYSRRAFHVGSFHVGFDRHLNHQSSLYASPFPILSRVDTCLIIRVRISVSLSRVDSVRFIVVFPSPFPTCMPAVHLMSALTRMLSDFKRASLHIFQARQALPPAF